MKQRSNQHYSEQRLAGLRATVAARKQDTIERLRTAILALEAAKRPISITTIREMSGLEYVVYARNPEALALFQARSTHLQIKRPRRGRKPAAQRTSPPDPLVRYAKGELIIRFRHTLERIAAAEFQVQQALQAYVEKDMRIARLEAQLIRTNQMQRHARWEDREIHADLGDDDSHFFDR